MLHYQVFVAGDVKDFVYIRVISVGCKFHSFILSKGCDL